MDFSHHFDAVGVGLPPISSSHSGWNTVCWREGFGGFSRPLWSMLPGAAREAQAGDEHFAKGRWADAHTHFLEAIRLEPNRADYYFAAAMCDWAGGQVDKAGEYLQTAVRLNPGLGTAQAWLGEWYLVQGMIDAALEATAIAMKLAPDNPAFMQSRAWVLEAAGEPDAAWALVKKLIASVQMTPSLARLYGRLAGRYGEQAQALEAINRLLGAGLCRGNHHCISRPLNCSTAREGTMRHSRWRSGPTLLRKGRLTIRPVRNSWVNLLIQYFTRERIRSLPKATLRSDKPVFIVGMPRSGTSLVEQILASHPSVHGAGELDFIYRVLLGTLDMLRAEMSAYPACLDNLTLAQANGMAHVYLGPFIALKPDAVRITDKMPLNFLHLGLISLFFPEARIIHCRRDPMDTCLSCFLTYFNKGHEFKQEPGASGTFLSPLRTADGALEERDRSSDAGGFLRGGRCRSGSTIAPDDRVPRLAVGRSLPEIPRSQTPVRDRKRPAGSQADLQLIRAALAALRKASGPAEGGALGKLKNVYPEGGKRDFYRYGSRAAQMPLLECGQRLSLRTLLAGLLRFVTAFRGEAKEATLFSFPLSTAVANFDRPANCVRSTDAVSHSSQRRWTARTTQPIKMLFLSRSFLDTLPRNQGCAATGTFGNIISWFQYE